MTEPTPERWLPVPGYEGFYEVSDLGRVRSLPHRDRRGISHPGVVRKPQRVGRGYRMVALSKGGVIRQAYVHRMVLEAFCGPCPEGMECLHGDDDKANNALSNLRWDAQAVNLRERVERDRIASGERNGMAKVTPEIVAEIRAARARGDRGTDTARQFGLSKAQVSRIGRGIDWARLPGADNALMPARGERSTRARFTEAQVRAMREAYAGGVGPSVLARRYQANPSTVSQIVHGKTWRHLL